MTIEISPNHIRPTKGIPAEVFAIGVILLTATVNALHLVL
jgi:hypothetical protein